MKEWWKKTVFYQVYMPSFCDGNNDGKGDFKGISSKLPYLKKLGVSGIWLTPFYPSPKVDQGYDISDYYNIDPDYGTMEEFEAFLQHAHELGIKVISDVVINHTSWEHAWFRESRESRDSKKRDWYVWRDGKDGNLPNNWESFFGGSAWEYDEKTESYYYHSFSKEQVDLNWSNPEVKEAVFSMLDFWADKGLDGFRLDVINNLTLTDCIQDNPVDENGNQIHKFDVNQEGIHEFMYELKKHFSEDRELFLVGEISSDELNIIHSYAIEGQLDTTFNFNIGSIKKFQTDEVQRQLSIMSELYGRKYPTIFFSSHDMARFASRFEFDEDKTRNLFTLMMTYRAIPFVYAGDEIGMKDYRCEKISDARDVQGILAYKDALKKGKSEKDALVILNRNTRDFSRNTMYWEDGVYGGFSTCEPWIPYQKQPGKAAREQIEDTASLFSYVAALIHLRSTHSVLIDGKCSVEKIGEDVILCKRWLENTEVWSLMNFSDHSVRTGLGNNEAFVRILLESVPGAAEVDGDELVLQKNSSVIVEKRRM